MVEIKSQQEAWVYPKVPILRSGIENLWNVEHYAVDFRADGTISVVVCELQRGGLSKELYDNFLCFNQTPIYSNAD